MNIKTTHYCTDEVWEVNGEEVKNEEELFDKALPVILKNLERGLRDGTVGIRSLMETLFYDYDREEGSCEQCGDSSYTMSWELKD